MFGVSGTIASVSSRKTYLQIGQKVRGECGSFPSLLFSLLQLWRRRPGVGSWRSAGSSWSRAPRWRSPTAAGSFRSSVPWDRATGRWAGSSCLGSGHPFHLAEIWVEKTNPNSFGGWSEWEVILMLQTPWALAGYRQLLLKYCVTSPFGKQMGCSWLKRSFFLSLYLHCVSYALILQR